jgi:outer membrane lipoprotein-sorting protein
MRHFILLLCLILIVPTTYAAKIKTTEDLVTAMQKKYAESWYKTATFVQKTIDYDKDGKQKVSTWYEALSVPGSLRIDFTPVKEGNGILFTERKLFSFKAGREESSREFVHPLMILGFDIYKLPFADVMAKLKALKFDVALLHEGTWQGRPVYVVGAKRGDRHSQQFWIDGKNLYFVRMLGPAGKDGAQTQETQFNKYQRLGGGWMAPEVVFKIDGRIRTH